MKDQLEKIIYNWVKQNFGETEADDPSWSIEALAEELDKHKYDIYREVERQYLMDDCERVARGMGVELTDKEKQVVVDEFMDSDAYVDVHAEDWQWFIKQELKHREENK